MYRSVGGVLSTVANQSTPVPNHTSNFEYFRSPSISGTNVAFYGRASGPTFRIGIYSSISGVLGRVADNGLPAPASGGSLFQGFSRTGIEGNLVSFFGDTLSLVEGVYRGSSYATLGVIADTNTAVPSGSGNFEALNSNVGSTAAISGSNLAFYASSASSSRRGIYKYVNGLLSRVADNTSPIPAGVGAFLGFSNVNIAIDNTNVAFIGHTTATTEGIYAQVGGVLRPIALDGQPRPGGGTFAIDDFTSLGFDDGRIAFRSGALYLADTAPGGVTTRIIGTGDPLDGRIIQSLDISTNGLSGSNLGFWAKFTNGSSGIYLATEIIPEPATLGALLVTLLLAQRRTRRVRF